MQICVRKYVFESIMRADTNFNYQTYKYKHVCNACVYIVECIVSVRSLLVYNMRVPRRASSPSLIARAINVPGQAWLHNTLSLCGLQG